MKTKLHFVILFFLTLFIIVSCSQFKQLSDNKYIKGTLIALAEEGDIGFFEMHTSFNQSYLALYYYKDFMHGKRFEDYYFKVKSIKDIPVAYDIRTIVEDESQIGIPPETKIDYHSISDHPGQDGFHILGHLDPPRITDLADGRSEIKILVISSNTEETFYGDARIKEAALDFGKGIIFIDHVDRNIISIDTCHMHGLHEVDCRRNYPVRP